MTNLETEVSSPTMNIPTQTYPSYFHEVYDVTVSRVPIGQPIGQFKPNRTGYQAVIQLLLLL